MHINDDCVGVLSVKVRTVIYIDSVDQAAVPNIRQQQSISRQRESSA
jgi:hypothetical protein